MIHDDQVISQNITHLTSAIFNNIFKTMNCPARLFPAVDTQDKDFRRWLIEVEAWCDTEQFWFACADELLCIHPDRLRKIIKDKCIALLHKEENDEGGGYSGEMYKVW